jgi:phospholipase C
MGRPEGIPPLGATPQPARTAPAAMEAAKPLVTPLHAEGAEALHKIDHIVVLMLENRSFDHMLGYLSLEAGRNTVDGLRPGMKNEHGGKTFPIHHLDRRKLTKAEDPAHDGKAIAEQMGSDFDMSGFVANFARLRPNVPDFGVPMGYYNASDLPVYDHLAREYAICHKWFSSVPGATWPNRLYAATGRCDGTLDGKQLPIYDIPSFFPELDRRHVSWRWYAHDVATLRLIDDDYRVGSFSNFAWFDRRSLLARENFLDHARDGKLPSVTWIDPNYVDVSFTGPSGSNDDHPPSDVMAGQELVFKTYNAIVRGPQWAKTMLIITYDEHGGFYDHLGPPEANDAQFKRYGVRVPAIVVSPFTQRGGIGQALYDHTSIVKTILLRFCRDASGKIPDMGERVNNAIHLGALLDLPAARPAEPRSAYQHLIDRLTAWRAEVFRARITGEMGVEAAHPDDLNDLQEEVLAAKQELRKRGLPEGQP